MRLIPLSIAAATLLAAPAYAQTIVYSIAPPSMTPTPGVWFASNVTSSGAVATASLAGAGGNLELGQPLPTGAARLTTTTNNNDRANIGLPYAFGTPGDIFPSLAIQYSWHKATNGTQNLTAAPSLKIAIFNGTCTDPLSAGDCFGNLIYEPSWNGPGSTSMTPISSNPALDTWSTSAIDFNTGLFWWSGGFGQPSGGGGPPLRTLAQWLAVMSSDFPGATVGLIEIGVGSFNQNQLGYVDSVSISHSFGAGFNETYDFEAPPPPFTGTNYAVGTAPNDVIAVDLTGDLEIDVATANGGSHDVTVLENDGAGGFPSSITIPLIGGDAPSSLAAGNLVIGGGTDLAVAAQNADAVRIVRNDLFGMFTISASLPTLPYTEPVSVAVGDLDGAAPDDVVVAMQGDLLFAGTGAVAVSLNGGALTALPAPIGGFLRPQSVAIADLDGDGDRDVVATMMGSAFSPTLTDNVLLFENQGGGVFAAPIALSVAQNPRGLCAADLDGDGDTDVAVTAESFPTILPGGVHVFRNGGLTPAAWTPAAFTAGGAFSGGFSPQDLACGDLRDDSLPGFISLQDLVAVDFGSQTLTRYDGYDGTSQTFGAQSTETANLVPVALDIAHLDHDKTLDVAVANKASNDVTILIARTPALAQTFGSGCIGSAGVPQIHAVGSPEFGNPAFGVRVTNARIFAPALLGVSLGQFTSTLGSCQLYLLPPLVLLSTVTSGTGEATVTLPIPGPLSGFAGCDAFFQYFIFDPMGGYAGQFAFSDALRIKVGYDP
jgi:hypothetical protein